MSERINIKWRADASPHAKRFVREQQFLKHLDGYERLEQEGWEVCELPPGITRRDAARQVEWLKNHGLVEPGMVEFDGVLEAIPVPVGDAVAQGVEQFDAWHQVICNIPQAHALTRGAGARVAVCDTGVDNTHPWLAPRLFFEKSFLGGYTPFDKHSHGTACAGAVVGMAPDAGLANARMASDSGYCYWSTAALAVLEMADLVDVISFSYGAVGSSSLTLTDAFRIAHEKGVASIVAAGNSGGSPIMFPAKLPTVFAVSATGADDYLAGFSSRDRDATVGELDICAPGVGIMSSSVGGGFGPYSGTSLATPLVAGVVALVVSKTGWSGLAAAQWVCEMAKKMGHPELYGKGRLDAGAAVGATDPIPLDTIKPSIPTGLYIRDLSSTGCIFGWQPSTDNDVVANYVPYKNGYQFETLAGNVTECRVNNSPGVIRLSVKAIDKTGNESDQSDFLSVSIPAADTPPPPPPPTDTLVDLTADATVTASFPAYEAVGEGLANLTDGTTRKCLWFNRDVTVTFKWPWSAVRKRARVKSANDYPTRDPHTMFFDGESVATAWTARHQDRDVEFNAAGVASDTLTVRMIAGTEWTPGDNGQGILQLGELRIFGFKPTTPPPPPEETWETIREVVSISQSSWSPVVAEQTATVTQTVRYYEKSNLGNVRNERTEQETSTTTRSVNLPQ